jgi:hypothetical protein
VTEGDGDVGPIAPEDGDIVLDTAEITLGPTARSAMRSSARPALSRLARRHYDDLPAAA